jgi:hypothetical protein
MPPAYLFYAARVEPTFFVIFVATSFSFYGLGVMASLNSDLALASMTLADIRHDGSDRHKVSTYTGQHNTEKLFVPRLEGELFHSV